MDIDYDNTSIGVDKSARALRALNLLSLLKQGFEIADLNEDDIECLVGVFGENWKLEIDKDTDLNE